MNDDDFCAGNYNTGFISNRLDIINNKHCDKTESMIAAIVGYKFVDNFKNKIMHKNPAIRNKWRERMK